MRNEWQNEDSGAGVLTLGLVPSQDEDLMLLMKEGGSSPHEAEQPGPSASQYLFSASSYILFSASFPLTLALLPSWLQWLSPQMLALAKPYFYWSRGCWKKVGGVHAQGFKWHPKKNIKKLCKEKVFRLGAEAGLWVKRRYWLVYWQLQTLSAGRKGSMRRRWWKGQTGESTEGWLCCDSLWTWPCIARHTQGAMLGPRYHCFVSLVSLFTEGVRVWCPLLHSFTYWLGPPRRGVEIEQFLFVCLFPTPLDEEWFCKKQHT